MKLRFFFFSLLKAKSLRKISWVNVHWVLLHISCNIDILSFSLNMSHILCDLELERDDEISHFCNSQANSNFFLARKEIIPLKKREILLSTSWRSLTNYINLYFCLPYKTQIHGKNFHSSPICTQLSILGRDWKLIRLCTHACTQTI